MDQFADTVGGKALADAASGRRMVFFTGLPASGKSFLLRQQTSIAANAGRRVHVMRWDSGLAAFETDSVLAKYPEVGDGTHPVIRKAAGLWARQAIARWLADYPDPANMLIGEAPIIGNRFSELVQALPDDAEPALASEATAFIYPVPTKQVRAKLEANRRASFANPQHPDEARDAPPATMEQAWLLTRAKAVDLGLVRAVESEGQDEYDETTCERFFEHLLQHRNARAIKVDRLLSNGGSAHDLDADVTELIATPREVADAIAAVEAAMSAESAARDIENWHLV